MKYGVPIVMFLILIVGVALIATKSGVLFAPEKPVFKSTLTEDLKTPLPTDTEPPALLTIEIGMSRREFLDACPLDEGDDVHTYETTDNKFITITMPKTPGRRLECAGRFTFLNGRLNSIGRGY